MPRTDIDVIDGLAHDAAPSIETLQQPGQQPGLLSVGDDLSKLTVGQLATMIDDMTRLVTTLGAHIHTLQQNEQRHGEPSAALSDTDDVSPDELQDLAFMLSRLEATRPA